MVKIGKNVINGINDKMKKMAKLEIRNQCQFSRVSQSLLPILSDGDIIMRIDKELIKFQRQRNQLKN